jgi:replicative DNA helicase
MNRVIAQTVEININELDGGQLSAANRNKILSEKSALSRLLSINDSGGQSIASIREYARTMARTAPLRAIVVDYLGLIADASKFKNRYEGITFISGELKRLAKDLNVPVIALAQLNRESARGNTKPTMADLRDSGSVEQDADVVMLLWRDLTDKRTEEKAFIELDVVKNRHGATKKFKYLFQGHQARVTTEIPDYDENS